MRSWVTTAALEAVILCWIAVLSKDGMRTHWALTSHLLEVWFSTTLTLLDTSIATFHHESLDMLSLHVLIVHLLGVAVIKCPWVTFGMESAVDMESTS